MHWVRFSFASLQASILATALLASCAGESVSVMPTQIAPSALLSTAQGGITDGRGRFREIFASVLARQCLEDLSGVPCDDGATLWRLLDEPPPTGRPVPTGPSKGAFRVVIVPGLLAECVADKSTAFADARSQLEKVGYKTDYIQTRGRKASGYNADLIRAAVAAMPTGDRIIFVTHSKGTVDTLEALAEYPAVAKRTAALVSVSGAVNGSPLADAFGDLLLNIAHRIPLSSCPPGEGAEAVESLRRHVRLSWLYRHPLPKSVRYYSLAAFTPRESSSRILRPFYDLLAKTDPVNDGMVLCSDAIVPGSVLLGYPNADHLAVAMPFNEEASPTLAKLIDKNSYPRAALLEAAIRFVEEDLRSTGPPGRLPGTGSSRAGSRRK